MTNKKLLKYYFMGWMDSAENKTRKEYEDEILQRAYTIGYLDFMVGDEVSSVDKQSERDIIRKIIYKFK